MPGAKRASIVVVAACLGLAGCMGSAAAPPESEADPSASESAVATGPETTSQAFEAVASGVYRIETTVCGEVGRGSGSGFRIDDDLVATVAHVVEGARTIAVRTPAGVVSGQVVGIDARRDVALIKARKEITGTTLVFGTTLPALNDEVVALGYPRALQLSPAYGRVTGLDRRVEAEDRSMTGMIQNDAAISGGNSGGPLVDAHGLVTGLVSSGYDAGAGLEYAVPAGVASGLVAAWKASPEPRPVVADCPDPASDFVTTQSVHPDAPAIAMQLRNYVEAIDEEYYDAAWTLLTGDLKGSYGSEQSFEDAQSTTHLSDVVLEKVSRRDETTNTADVRFVSTQDAAHGPGGQTCSVWHLRYTLRVDTGDWLIDSAEELGGPPRDCSSPSSPAASPAASLGSATAPTTPSALDPSATLPASPAPAAQ